MIHKSDKVSPLSWNKMEKTKLRHPKKVLTYVAVISVISSLAVPYIYAQKCGMKLYDIVCAEVLLVSSVRGVLGDSWYARQMGDEYSPNEEITKHFNLEPDAEKALWWYELAKYSPLPDKKLENKITYCKEYIEENKK